MRIILKNHSLFVAVHETITCLFPEEAHGISEEYATDGIIVSEIAETESYIKAYTKVTKNGKIFEDSCLLQIDSPNAVRRKQIATKAVKTSAYLAAVKLLSVTPQWGAMSGVKPAKPLRMRFKGEIDEAKADEILRDEFYIAPKRRSLTINCAKQARALENEMTAGAVAIYIGIPFCPSRCAYCSFVSSVADKTHNLIKPYLAAICEEIIAVGKAVKQNSLTVDSIYIGGGTPTTLDEYQLETLLACVCKHLPKPKEFTVEAGRPETITSEKLQCMKNHGVGRISINPQSMDNKVLQAVGRMHSVAEIEEKFEMARKIGGFEINMDLIAGLPLDTNEGFLQSVNKLIALNPENITIHCLARKKGRQMENFNSELDAETIDSAHEAIYNAGYKAYYLYRQKHSAGNLENVGFAKNGTICRYNICMMEELCPVIAIGAGGVTRLTGKNTGEITRLANPKYAKEYIENIGEIVAKKRDLKLF